MIEDNLRSFDLRLKLEIDFKALAQNLTSLKFHKIVHYDIFLTGGRPVLGFSGLLEAIFTANFQKFIIVTSIYERVVTGMLYLELAADKPPV